MISNEGKASHYLTVKGVSALLREIASKYYSNFYCMNFFHFFSTKINFKNLNRGKDSVKIKIFVAW